MDISKATGADDISAKVLKTAASYSSNVVSNISNACYQYGRFPSSWKTARVTPLFKGRSKTDRDNRRAISVLLCISKAQEIFANLDLQEFGTKNNLIGDHQFAYARNSPTIGAFIITVDSWKFAIDKGEKVVCAFLDLKKAFDITDHDILISKLLKTQVIGNELKWFTSYRHERKQFYLSSSKA
ncbi:Hypothetical predicted protein [Paramuricea clavata]|uniref:Uncharacterized protein n=1 Tax=Paramuricea clavata TaxID=317549 RepID=A0A7D9ERC8_PARCT|nr:Hypothetical predicted protein [Paramuricea clavata]